MSRCLALATALAASMLVGAGCGDDVCSELSGSAGSGLSLSFSSVEIQHSAGGPSLVIKYKSSTTGFPAIMSVDSAGLPFKSGMTLNFVGDQPKPGEDPYAFGNVERVMPDNQQFASGEVDSGTLTLESFGGGRAEGSIGYRFKGAEGASLRGSFCSDVTEVTN